MVPLPCVAMLPPSWVDLFSRECFFYFQESVFYLHESVYCDSRSGSAISTASHYQSMGCSRCLSIILIIIINKLKKNLSLPVKEIVLLENSKIFSYRQTVTHFFVTYILAGRPTRWSFFYWYLDLDLDLDPWWCGELLLELMIHLLLLSQSQIWKPFLLNLGWPQYFENHTSCTMSSWVPHVPSMPPHS